MFGYKIRFVKWLSFSLLFLLFSYTEALAQLIENPVFDRSDVPAFRVEKVEITHDTTYFHCLYQAEEHSWANLSHKTYLEDIISGTRYPILQVYGIPFSPEQRIFDNDTLISVSLCFPKINSSRFNLIEGKNTRAFNIYGINVNKTYFSKYSHEQYWSYGLMAYQLDSLGRANEAVGYKKRQLEMAQYLYGLQSYECAAALYDLCLYSSSEIDSSILYGEQALQILETIPQTKSVKEDIARISGSLMSLYVAGKKDYKKGFDFGEKSLSIRQEIYKNTPDYVNFLVRLIGMYSDANYASRAAFHSKELQKIYKEISDSDPKYNCSYIYSLLNSGDYHFQADNFEEARRCAEEASKLMKEGKCNNPETLFHAYNLLAMSNDDVDKAIDYYKKAQDIAKRSKQIEPQRYAQSLRLLGNLYSKLKNDTINAVACYEEALGLLKNRDDFNCLAQLAQLYDALGLIYYKTDVVKSKNYYERYIQIIGNLYGTESILYGNALKNKSVREFRRYINNMENKDVLVSDIYNSSNIIKRYLDTSMLVSNKKERLQLWQEYRELFDWWIPNVAFYLDSEEMNSLAFDASLFYKGYMMGMDFEIKKQLLESESDDIKIVYSRYLSTLNALEQIRNASNSKGYHKTDSLKRVIAEDELYLTKSIFKSGFKFDKTNLSWKYIQLMLNDNDIAIEFVSFKGLNKSDGREYYIALVLSNKMSSPKMIELFEKSELDSLMNLNNPDFTKISKLIWNEDLLIEIDGYDNIYFSPAGRLNSLGMEYLPIPNSESINHIYNLFRLSSLKELYKRNNHFKLKKAILYGDLDYNWKEGKNLSDSYRHPNHVVSVSRAYADSLSSRGGFDLLNNTKEEILGISKVLSNSGIENELFSGRTGTEESFKSLSGKDINIIHLATHGMYVSQIDALKKREEQNFVFISSDEGKYSVQNDMSLTRSALVMSGGNKLLRRESISLKEDDEILTALEISNLEFKELDLVVLSACQTALGDVDSEGVYGLQRGFKKAGANTILMSLDKVDDEATKILMVEFYRNLMSGKTKHQSLKDAQKYLRQIDNGKYDKPEYWASFILLDGLN